MIYVSNIKCKCGNFLVATKSGLICPHCANQYDYTKLHVCGDLIEISVSADVSWYKEHVDKLKDIEDLTFLGFDDHTGESTGFVDFGFEDLTQETAVRLVNMLDIMVDDRVTSLNLK